MGGHSKRSCSSYPKAIPPPQPDYVVSGNGIPNPNGNYFLAGNYLGSPYYKKTDDSFFIFYVPLDNAFYLSTILSGGEDASFAKEDMPIIGIYSHIDPSTGTATVTAGP